MNSKVGCATMIVLFLIAAGISWAVTSGIIWLICLRAEEAAEETNALLDDEVHPACDYSLYLAVHDSVSDIVNWEHDDVWRGHKEE